MTKQELAKVEKIVSFLTDKNVGEMERKNQIQGDDERLGALIALGDAFQKSYKILQELRLTAN